MAFLLGLALALPLLAPGGDLREQDVVYLKDGKTVEGWVVYADDAVVIVRTGSREQTLSRYDVRELDARCEHQDELLDRLEAAGPLDAIGVDELVELARFADHGRLPGEARVLYLAALLADPTQPEALDALEARRRSKGFAVKNQRSWVKTDELAEPPEEWKDRWTLSTAHFELQTNLGMDEAVATAIDMERFFRAFYDLFAKELRLLEPDEILEVQVHGDETSFPERGDDRAGYFDPSDRIVSVDATRAGWSTGLFRGLTEMLVYETTQRTPAAKGVMPPWVTEGLALALGTGVSGEAGRSRFDLSSLDERLYKAHAAELDTYDLARVLVFTQDDYLASTHRELRYAVSYTLVHFLLYGDDGAWRERFMDFLRSAYAGQSSMSHFEKILDVDLDDLQAAWLQSVESLAARF